MPVRSVAKSAFFAGARRLGVNALLRRVSRGKLLAVCYHGVISEDHPEDPMRTRNCVSLREFRMQLSALRRLFNPVSAADVVESVERRTPLPDNAMLVTFDDGFRNNLSCAAPELERQGVPALINIVTGFIGGDRLLWTQELDERILCWEAGTIPMPDGRPDIDTPPHRVYADPGCRQHSWAVQEDYGDCQTIVS